ncbi:hypothetical protein PENTCL1PPCAC_12365, partial [Pristionchus entomophagus]
SPRCVCSQVQRRWRYDMGQCEGQFGGHQRRGKVLLHVRRKIAQSAHYNQGCRHRKCFLQGHRNDPDRQQGLGNGNSHLMFWGRLQSRLQRLDPDGSSDCGRCSLQTL